MSRRPLTLVLALAALLGFAWSLVTIQFAGFDETDHVGYAVHLAHTGEAPAVGSGDSPYGGAEALALFDLGLLRAIANPGARPPWREVDREHFERREDALPADASSQGSGPNPIAKNPPLYYALVGAAARAAPGGVMSELQAMRLVTVGLLPLAALFAWLAVAELGLGLLARTTAAGIVALQPVAGSLAGTVNPDAMLMAIWSLYLWLALRTLARGPTPGRVAALAAVTAASLLTHGRGIALVPVFVVTLGVVLWRSRATLPSRRAALIGALGVAVVAAAILGLRAFTSGTPGGSAFGGEVSFAPQGYSVRGFLEFLWRFYLPEPGFFGAQLGPDYGFGEVWVGTFLGSYGSYASILPDALLDAGRTLLLGGGALLLALAVTRREALRRRLPQVLIVGAAGLAMLGLLHLASYRALLGGGSDPLITGRYLLPVLPVLAIGGAAVVHGLGRRWGGVVAGVVLPTLLLMSVTGLGVTLVRSYV